MLAEQYPPWRDCIFGYKRTDILLTPVIPALGCCYNILTTI